MGAMIDFLRLMTKFLDEVLGMLISETVQTDPSAPPKIGEISAPEFERVVIPSWTSMPAAT